VKLDNGFIIASFQGKRTLKGNDVVQPLFGIVDGFQQRPPD